MITDLTPEQEAQLQVYAEKWRAIGLSTEPANRAEAEKGVRLAYELAGLNPPKEILWFESPMAMAEYVYTHTVDKDTRLEKNIARFSILLDNDTYSANVATIVEESFKKIRGFSGELSKILSNKDLNTIV